MPKQKLYGYVAKVGGEIVRGTTFDTHRENVIRDVRSNYGTQTTRIVVYWIKENSPEFCKGRGVNNGQATKRN